MAITDLPVVRAFKEKLRFHGERQKVLAENIANATTPGYRGRDIAAPDFFRVAVEGSRPGPIGPAVTNVAHMPGHVGNAHHFKDGKVDGYEITPDGNAVVLEEQMMKVAQNQMDYQVATSLYQRSLGMLRTAVGRR